MENRNEAGQRMSHLDEKRAELDGRLETRIRQFSQAARVRDRARLARILKQINLTNEFVDTLDRIAADMRQKARHSRNRYAVSSLFLHECYKELTRDQSENFFFITGSEVDGVFVLDQRAEFAHQTRTAVGVVGDTRSTHRLLIKLEQFGHRLLGHFHSHPGNGADATHPSGTDENFQKRLESGGHIALAAIFSRDGFVRFFRLDGNLEIQIYGEGIEKHNENVFRLKNIDPA